MISPGQILKKHGMAKRTCLTAASANLPSSLVSGSDNSRTQNTKHTGRSWIPPTQAGRPTGIDEIHLRHGQNGQRLEHWGRLPVIPRGPTNVGPAPCSRWHPQQWARRTWWAPMWYGLQTGLTSLLPSTIPLSAVNSLGIELSRPAASAGPLSRADSPLGQNPPCLNIFFSSPDFDVFPLHIQYAKCVG